MSLGSSKKRLAQFAFLALAAGEVSYAAAQVLVLRSVGPSARNHPAGQRLPDSATFTLRPGDSVVVLARGGTRTFRGPGTFSATGPVRTGGLASAPTQVRRQTGAVRGPGDVEVRRPEDVWHVDVSQSGRACIVAGRQPVLWRPNSDRTVQLTITPQAGAAQTLSWEKGQATLGWPAAIPIVDGASYQLNWTGAPGATRLTTHTLAGVPVEDVEAVATAFVDNKCRGQLDVLIATREDAESSRSSSAGGSGSGATLR